MSDKKKMSKANDIYLLKKPIPKDCANCAKWCIERQREQYKKGIERGRKEGYDKALVDLLGEPYILWTDEELTNWIEKKLIKKGSKELKRK